MKRNQKGFALVELIILIIVLAIIGAAGYFLFSRQKNNDTPQSANKTIKINNTYQSCPDPILKTPVDITKVTSILYPGQTRGGNYKPHGGFRLDNSSSNSVEVKAPMDAKLIAGSRYIEQGEEQILLDFQSGCGVNYRFDHLSVVSPTIQKAVDKLPAAKPDDSRTTNFSDQVSVKAGDVIATAVGFEKTKNIAFDFGVYDTRQPNKASKDAAYKAVHPDLENNEQLKFAVCWLDFFTVSESKTLRALPAADQVSGKTSDYCD